MIVIFGSGFGGAAIGDVAGVKSRSSSESSKEDIDIELRELRVEGDDDLIVGNEAASDLSGLEVAEGMKRPVVESRSRRVLSVLDASFADELCT